MKNPYRSSPAFFGFAMALCVAQNALAQNATVTLTSQKQYIHGFGGINHAAWAGDLTAAERTLAFGNASGQLGFSILRIPVTDGNPDSVNVATAKAAIANGAIVFATPWNAAKTYTSADFATYASHLSGFVSYMKNQGVDLYSISVQNEPDYGATAGWGSWTAAACHDFVLNYGAAVATSTTKLMSCESFSYNKSYYDPILNDPAALANVGVFGTHLYGTAVSAYAYPLFDQKAGGKERWMTEHYTDSTTDANSWPNALGVASELHNAMVTGQFNAYVWWYIKRSYGPINNGAVTKRGDCMGQWSKFIRPGFYRVDATATPASGLSLSAYKGDSSVVIVVVNTGSSASSLSIAIPGSTLSSFSKYTTSASKSLASDGTVSASNGAMSVSFDASSVTTLVGSGTSTGGSGGAGGASGSGGTSSGGAGTSGGGTSSGGAGTSGGGTSSGGAGTSGGGTSNGGAGTSGGSAGTSGGGVSQGGFAGTAGVAGSAAGNGGATSAGASGATGTGGATAGTAGATAGTTGASAGTAGANASGGATGTSGSSSASGAGNPGSGGNAVAGGDTGNLDAPAEAASQPGCSCRVAGGGTAPQPFTLAGLLGLLVIGAARRRNK
ncbi:MAG TPA: MYXO-CTERM sorting domain-containing protein [Polyangiaceae bacterium]